MIYNNRCDGLIMKWPW